MSGELRGDISRNTFRPKKHFLRVPIQQGRVQLDADVNERSDILLHYLQTLACDIIGPFGGPKDSGFNIEWNKEKTDVTISKGRYYVNGLLCENDEDGVSYLKQPDYPQKTLPDDIKSGNYLVYLDVWERHISAVEDESIRETALGGPDTSTRSQLVWQVKLHPLNEEQLKNLESDKNCYSTGKNRPEKTRGEIWSQYVNSVFAYSNPGQLTPSITNSGSEKDSICQVSSPARYRGLENRLYRVEIHKSGRCADGNSASFKWSRDNSSVTFPVTISKNEFKDDKSGASQGISIKLLDPGRDNRSTLKIGDWVEIIDDDYTKLVLSRPSPLDNPRPLVQIKNIDKSELTVTLTSYESIDLEKGLTHPLLRRWDMKPVDNCSEGLEISDTVITLDDGIGIRFPNPGEGFFTGDYWLIPARASTGEIDWPKETNETYLSLPPDGIDHHYAPLALIKGNGDPDDYRYLFSNLPL